MVEKVRHLARRALLALVVLERLAQLPGLLADLQPAAAKRPTTNQVSRPRTGHGRSVSPDYTVPAPIQTRHNRVEAHADLAAEELGVGKKLPGPGRLQALHADLCLALRDGGLVAAARKRHVGDGKREWECCSTSKSCALALEMPLRVGEGRRGQRAQQQASHNAPLAEEESSWGRGRPRCAPPQQ